MISFFSMLPSTRSSYSMVFLSDARHVFYLTGNSVFFDCCPQIPRRNKHSGHVSSRFRGATRQQQQQQLSTRGELNFSDSGLVAPCGSQCRVDPRERGLEREVGRATGRVSDSWAPRFLVFLQVSTCLSYYCTLFFL